jgi:lipid-A-disaccharide synthase
MSREVLVVAGEPSGDRIAALAAAALAEHGVRCFGAAGPASRAAGVEILADTGALGAMGLADVAARLPALARTTARVLGRVYRDPPRAALLVNFTELNQRLARVLRARGARVLWVVAPQVWAWRAGRLKSLRGSIDRLAVVLPFEEELWRAAGYDARYVGHPSLDVPSPPRAELRARLGIAAGARAVAVLPGSRPGEIARLSAPLASAARVLLDEGRADAARVLVAPGLPAAARALVERAARNADLPCFPGDPDHGAAPLLGAFDASLVASGTASLEAALAAAAPVVAYRLDPVAFAIARRLVRTPFVALPNVLLARRAFPEILQDEVTPARLAAAARDLLARPEEARALAAELRAALAPPSPEPFGARLASLILPWIA